MEAEPWVDWNLGLLDQHGLAQLIVLLLLSKLVRLALVASILLGVGNQDIRNPLSAWDIGEAERRASPQKAQQSAYRMRPRCDLQDFERTSLQALLPTFA